jgi:hypothetical protein
MIAARAGAAEFPERERRLVRRCVSQREDDFFRTKLLTRVFTPVFNGESAIGRSALDAGAELNVTRSAF